MEGLERADDIAVWGYAKENGFVIVSKDSDFHEISVVRGPPPQVIWLRVGKTEKARLIQLLTENSSQIRALLAEPQAGCVEVE